MNEQMEDQVTDWMGGGRSDWVNGVTWLADANRLQVRLLDVGEVLEARDVEAVAHAQVVLVELNLRQQLVQPLSVLVH